MKKIKNHVRNTITMKALLLSQKLGEERGGNLN